MGTTCAKSLGNGAKHDFYDIKAIVARATISKVLSIEGPPNRKSFSSKLDSLTDLRSITLKNLGLVELPEVCLTQSSKSLKILKLQHNYLTLIPAYFCEFRTLKTLDLSSNALSYLDFDFRAFPPSLEWLSLQGNQLKGTFVGLEHLESLVHLDVSDNPGVTTLDGSNWAELRSLEEINLDRLSLTSLPKSMGRAPRLLVISAQSNKLSATSESFPVEILRDSPFLHTLHLEGNDDLKETDFMLLPGVASYLERRKAKVNKQLAGGTIELNLAVI